MKVLLGLTSSEESAAALDRTVSRASAAGDELVVAVLTDVDGTDADAAERRAREATAEAGVDADVRRVEGDPGSRLVELADQVGADELVIGGGTESPMGKIRLGRVTEFVVLNARTTVTLVR